MTSRSLGIGLARSGPWLLWLLTGVAAALAWLALGASAHPLGSDPVCLMRRTLHLACPTCGVTRALMLLARGELAAAFALHPWAPIVALEAWSAWALWGVARARGIGGLDRWIPHVVAANAAGLFALWLVRLLTGTLLPV